MYRTPVIIGKISPTGPRSEAEKWHLLAAKFKLALPFISCHPTSLVEAGVLAGKPENVLTCNVSYNGYLGNLHCGSN